MKVEYMQGKYNKIAAFLSHINCDTNEINEITDSSQSNEGSVENDEISNNATVHSQKESDENDIGILETIVNSFKYQLIIEPDKGFP